MKARDASLVFLFPLVVTDYLRLHYLIAVIDPRFILTTVYTRQLLGQGHAWSKRGKIDPDRQDVIVIRGNRDS